MTAQEPVSEHQHTYTLAPLTLEERARRAEAAWREASRQHEEAARVVTEHTNSGKGPLHEPEWEAYSAVWRQCDKAWSAYEEARAVAQARAYASFSDEDLAKDIAGKEEAWKEARRQADIYWNEWMALLDEQRRREGVRAHG